MHPIIERLEAERARRAESVYKFAARIGTNGPQYCAWRAGRGPGALWLEKLRSIVIMLEAEPLSNLPNR